MRLDHFLKLSCLIPRRTVAKELCDKGAVSVNQRTAKAATTVAAGDLIEFTAGRRRRVVKVLEVPTRQISKKMAATLFAVVTDEALPKEEDFF